MVVNCQKKQQWFFAPFLFMASAQRDARNQGKSYQLKPKLKEHFTSVVITHPAWRKRCFSGMPPRWTENPKNPWWIKVNRGRVKQQQNCIETSVTNSHNSCSIVHFKHAFSLKPYHLKHFLTYSLVCGNLDMF